MKLKTRLLVAVGTLFILSFGTTQYIDYRAAQQDIVDDLLHEARTLRRLLTATSNVYQQQFLDSGLPLDDRTLGLLPAHALGRISRQFERLDFSGTIINNVSDRPRSPENAADPSEMTAIHYFREHPEAEERLTVVSSTPGEHYHLYTAPIRVEAFCLGCHGNKADAPPVIRARYDSGFGYRVGDLRGILSIKLPAGVIETRVFKQMRKSGAVHLVSLTLMSFLVYSLLQRIIVRRLERLEWAADALARGETRVNAGISGNDEIARVSRAFDIMARAVAERSEAIARQMNLLKNILSNIPHGIFWKDRQSIYLGCGPSVAQTAGLTAPEDIVGKSDFDLPWTREEAEFFRQCDREVMESGRPLLNFEETLRQPDGRTATMLTSKVPLRNPAGEVIGILGVYADISDRKRAEETLAAERAFLQTVIDGVADPLMVIGLDYRVLLMNRAACSYLPEEGPAAATLLCHQVSHRCDRPCQGKEHPCPLEQVRREGRPFTLVHRHTLPDGQERFYELTAFPLRGEDGTLQGIIESSRDITDRIRTEQVLCQNRAHLQYMAHHDALTGLPNRMLFQDHLQHAMAEARRSERQVALLFLDLDRFKNINDSLGHEIGDRLLREVAGRLRRSVREVDTVARLGGDEFVVILEQVEEIRDVAVVAQKLLHALVPPFQLEEHELFITASIGIGLFPTDGMDVESMMKCADAAMFRAKECGRNNYQFYTTGMNARTFELLLLEGSLRRALEQEQLILHYQPQVELGSGRLLGLEALVRWRHPEQGMISPGDFIPLAEDTGLIVPIGEWVLQTACAQSRAWQERGYPPLRVAVNISARQFRQAALLRTVAAALEQSGLQPELLELEITESMIMQDVEAAIATMHELKKIGVRLAIDDFGSGYSSLSYLKRFPIDRLKLDQVFVRDVHTDSKDAAIAAAVVFLAGGLGIEVIAEGVESEAQRDFLHQKGYGQAQGFLFGRPGPPAAIEDLLRHSR